MNLDIKKIFKAKLDKNITTSDELAKGLNVSSGSITDFVSSLSKEESTLLCVKKNKCGFSFSLSAVLIHFEDIIMLKKIESKVSPHLADSVSNFIYNSAEQLRGIRDNPHRYGIPNSVKCDRLLKDMYRNYYKNKRNKE